MGRFRLGGAVDAESAGRCPKVARLHELALLGLPVPAGIVLDPPVLRDEDRAPLEDLLAHGCVIVRSAHPEEDGESASWAGLGTSVADCADETQVAAALETIREHAASTWSQVYGDDAGAPCVLIQRQVARAWLVVAVWTPEGEWYVEAHDAPGEVLSAGASPRFAGPLSTWPAAAKTRILELCERARRHVRGRFGLDLEIVVDPQEAPWLVQARPLTAPLHPAWPAFARAMEADSSRESRPPDLGGLLTLDGEHNPAPLSPAHASLIDWLRARRPQAGDPVVLAGWLYVRTLPRDLPAGPSDVDVHDALARLEDEHLPRLRRHLDALRERLESCDAATLGPALADARALFLEMIDCYLGELVPARRAARRGVRADPGAPLTLRSRQPFLDVLPAAWDLASPSLSDLITVELGDHRATPRPTDDAAAATLLAEWDDHLFALGLAALRLVYLRGAELVGLSTHKVFMLTPTELLELAAGAPPDAFAPRIRERQRALGAQADLHPPLRLWNGRPLPAPSGTWLRGIPIGTPFTGRIAQRPDLERLIADPPDTDAIVCIPALTAQAAVALDGLGLRAICTEFGGALSHGALMSRELGLSALIACRGCTTLRDGGRARLDTRAARLVDFG